MTAREDVKGHIYDPAAEGFPFVSVVVCPGREPAVDHHRSRKEAERELEEKITILRRAVTGRA